MILPDSFCRDAEQPADYYKHRNFTHKSLRCWCSFKASPGRKPRLSFVISIYSLPVTFWLSLTAMFQVPRPTTVIASGE
jgi:hypothetical protein